MSTTAIHRACVSTLVAGALLMFTSPAVSAALPELSSSDGNPTLAPLLERVTPAVVNISVETGSPAARNGLRPGNFIVAVNREPVRNAAEFRRAIEI